MTSTVHIDNMGDYRALALHSTHTTSWPQEPTFLYIQIGGGQREDWIYIRNGPWTESQLRPSSLAKGFAHGPLFLHPWQNELDIVIPADHHLAVFTGQAYKEDITFDQWVLLTFACLGRFKMAVPSVYIFDCIHVMFP